MKERSITPAQLQNYERSMLGYHRCVRARNDNSLACCFASTRRQDGQADSRKRKRHTQTGGGGHYSQGDEELCERKCEDCRRIRSRLPQSGTCRVSATLRNLLSHVSPALMGLEPLDRASCLFGQACAAMRHVFVCAGVVVYACAFICNRVSGCVCRYLHRCGCVHWCRLICVYVFLPC